MRPRYREEPCRTALNRVTGMGFRWSLNPYTGCVHRCAFCYVRGFERRADRPSDDRYGTDIRVKTNIPYQPAEGRYRLTRGCVEALGEARTPIDLITRGPMIVRDLDVLAEASRRASVRVTVSIATLDAELAARLEPGVAAPAQRLRAIRTLTEAGIAAGVALAPVVPGLTDEPAAMRAVLAAARDAGAVHAWSTLLNLRAGTREHFLEVLAREWPEELARYRRLYPPDGGYLRPADARPLERRVAAARAAVPLEDRRRIRLVPPPDPEQLAFAGWAADSP